MWIFDTFFKILWSSLPANGEFCPIIILR